MINFIKRLTFVIKVRDTCLSLKLKGFTLKSGRIQGLMVWREFRKYKPRKETKQQRFPVHLRDFQAFAAFKKLISKTKKATISDGCFWKHLANFASAQSVFIPL